MPDTALNVAQVLWEEHTALARTAAASPDQPATDSEIYRRLNQDNHWALCLSGGGIRSAAFALGILQRFAAQPIAPKASTDERGSALQQFEYLSTVSGGGYIGSWLSAWLFQERQKRADADAKTKAAKIRDAKTKDPKTAGTTTSAGANEVVRDLNGRIGDHEEVGSVSNLRRDSHYLAPSFSAISPDLWSAVAAVVRNLCLNWILLVPPMILAVLATKALAYVFIDALHTHDLSTGLVPIMIAAMVCFVVALSFSAANRPARGLINASQIQFLVCDMAVFLIGTALLIFVLGSPGGRHVLSFECLWVGDVERLSLTGAVLLRGVLLGLAIHLVSWFAAPIWNLILRQAPQHHLESRIWIALVDLGSWCVGGAAFGMLVAVGYLLVFRFFPTEDPAALATLVGICGLPWIVAARVIADVIFIAFADFIPGADAGLEYQARAGGIFTLAQLGWLIWFGLVLGAPHVAQLIPRTSMSLAAVGGISGAFSVIVGASSKTAATIQQVAKFRQYLSLNTLAAIAAAVFAAVLVAAWSVLIGWTFEALGHGASHPSWTLVWIAGAALGALVVAASFVISINRYSLHSLYRNRLVRAFLGASRDEDTRDSSKNRFTDFDSFDSPLLHQLWAPGNPRGDNWRPLHVVNAALNLVSSKNLAWQERMAAPFTFSPLHCGSGSSVFSDGAYRPTYLPPDQGKPYGGRLGLTLGTAMAISGAAVSPNMGYNTSPGVAFLMALFNVRLGWWLANPRGDNPHYWRTGPLMALRPYFMEMFGLTSETERWVYLSDGGHFENLGIYEMVRRRCRVIVVSDAGCDPDYTFDDLGNALRKIWIDLGVRVDVDGLDRLKKRFTERPTPATRAPYWATGRIRYNAADGSGEDGYLLYFKSGLHGTEPMDVLSYAMTHATFPHESTANQFFTESQFESYRQLGFEIAERALEDGGCAPLDPRTSAPDPTGGPGAKANLTLEDVIKKLATQLERRDAAIAQSAGSV